MVILENPLVSVIVPCYNHEKYIVQCLDSIKLNGYNEIEIIIIDDGSTDNSASIIEEWINSNKNIPIEFISRPNKGIVGTLNELIDTSKGEFLCLLASDDLLVTGGIECRVRALENNFTKMAVIGDAYVIDSEGNFIMDSAIVDLWKGNKANYESDEGLKNMVLRNFSVPGPVLLVRKKIYNIIGKYPSYLIAEDFYFYLSVISRELLLYIDIKVSCYRVHNLNTCVTIANKDNNQINNFFTKSNNLPYIKSYLKNIRHFKLSDQAYILRLVSSHFKSFLKFKFFKSN